MGTLYGHIWKLCHIKNSQKRSHTNVKALSVVSELGEGGFLIAIMWCRFECFREKPEEQATLSEIASHFHLFSINFNNINFGTLLFLVPNIGRVQKTFEEGKSSQLLPVGFSIDSDFLIGET